MQKNMNGYNDYNMMLAASGGYSVDTYGICLDAPRSKPHMLAKHAKRLEGGY